MRIRILLWLVLYTWASSKTANKCPTLNQRKRLKLGMTISATIMRPLCLLNTSNIWIKRQVYPNSHRRHKRLHSRLKTRLRISLRRRIVQCQWCKLQHSRLHSNTEIRIASLPRVLNWNSKLKSASSGSWTAHASMVTLAHSHMAVMNSSKEQTCTRTTRPSSASDSIKIFTVHMAPDASSFTMNLKPAHQQKLPKTLKPRERVTLV